MCAVEQWADVSGARRLCALGGPVRIEKKIIIKILFENI